MVGLDYPRRKKMQIIAIVLLLLICVFMLAACNKDSGVYNVDVSSSADIAKPTHFMAKFMLTLNDSIGNFGWTVVVFTVILRLILSPLDLWQKIVARRNSKAMERMRPQLESMKEKYKNDNERYQQEQMALYKKEKYSMVGACLPMIITMVVFFVVFAGFRQMVGYQFALDYKNSYDVYEQAMMTELPNYNPLDETSVDPETYYAAQDKAQSAVREAYFADTQTDMRTFLWIKNIFVSDTWKKSVPDYLTVTGQSGFATAKLQGVTIDEYNTVMAKVLGEGGWGKNGKWNGWLLLPVLSIVLSFLSSKLMAASQVTPPPTILKTGDDENGKPKDGMQNTMKMMQYFMPLLMGVFALLYSGAFALYMFTSSLAAIVFQVAFNILAKIVDKSRDKKSGVVKYKR